MARIDHHEAERESKGERSREANRAVDEFLHDLETLRVAYERFFSGVDRVPPVRLNEQLGIRGRKLGADRLLNTEQKFRVRSAKARLLSLQQYWNRILRSIEDGKFERVMTKASRNRRARDATGGPEKPRPKTQAAPAVQGQAELPPGIDAREARRLFKELVTAKRALGESTRGMTYGSLVNSLAREFPKLRRSHGAGLQFCVTTRDGQVKLSARKLKTAGS